MISVEGWAILAFLLVETIIMAISVWIQIDDVYGVTQLRKASKRAMRRYWQRFLKTSKKYFTRKEKKGKVSSLEVQQII